MSLYESIIDIRDGWAHKVFNALYTLFIDQKLCDFTVSTEHKNYVESVECHKAVLAATSPYFAQLFLADDGKTQFNISEVPNTTTDVIHEALTFLYTGHCYVTEANVNGLLELGSLWRVEELVSDCVNFVVKGINLENCLQHLTFSLRYNVSDDVKTRVLRYIRSHFIELHQSNKLINVSLGEFTCILSNNRFDEDSRDKLDEEVVFEAVEQWSESNPSSPVESLLSLISYDHMTSEYLLDTVLMHNVLSSAHRETIKGILRERLRGNNRRASSGHQEQPASLGMGTRPEQLSVDGNHPRRSNLHRSLSENQHARPALSIASLPTATEDKPPLFPKSYSQTVSSTSMSSLATSTSASSHGNDTPPPIVPSRTFRPSDSPDLSPGGKMEASEIPLVDVTSSKNKMIKVNKSNKLCALNVAKKKWNVLSRLPYTTDDLTSACVHGSHIVFVGCVKKNVHKRCCIAEVDGGIGSAILPDLPTDGKEAGVAHTGSEIYVTGGGWPLRHEVYALDLHTVPLQWKKCANMLYGVCAHQSWCHKGHIYVVGGKNGEQDIRFAQRYSIADDIWELCADCPVDLDASINKGLTLDGVTSFFLPSTRVTYNSNNNQWSQQPYANGETLDKHTHPVLYDGKIFVVSSKVRQMLKDKRSGVTLKKYHERKNSWSTTDVTVNDMICHGSLFTVSCATSTDTQIFV